MPHVAQLVDQARRFFGELLDDPEKGNAWVDECMKRSMAGEPGFFYAREGDRWVGTPGAGVGIDHRQMFHVET